MKVSSNDKSVGFFPVAGTYDLNSNPLPKSAPYATATSLSISA